MNARTIAPLGVVMQELQYYNGKPQMDNGDVYCPMCEIWHENNTLCQMTMEGY